MKSSVSGQSLTSATSSNQFMNQKLKKQFVDVENVRLHYVESGSGRPVILIHGNAGSLQDFEFGTLALLANNYRTIAFDLPGHGSSERSKKAKTTIEDQASILHRALAGLGIREPVVLVGHSWGGAVALAYALHYPNDVAGLVLLAPAAYPDHSSQPRIAGLLDVPLLGDLCLAVIKPIVSLRILKRELKVAFYPDRVPDDYWKTAKTEWLGSKQIRAFIHDDQELNQSLHELSSSYRNLHMPIVIVTGDSDRMVSPKENAYLLHEAVPESELIVLYHAGHQIPEIHPEAVLQALQTIVPNATHFTFAAAN